MVKMLAIESSAAMCSVALGMDGVVSSREVAGARSHTQFMLAFIDEVLQEQQCSVADLDAIVFAAGPGSFTGVRLATSVAKALAYAAGIALLPVSSLAAIAQTAGRGSQSQAVQVITDARMGEVYVGSYAFDADGIACALQEDALLTLDQLLAANHCFNCIAGDARPLLHDKPGFSNVSWLEQAAHARDLLLLGERHWREGRAETALAAQAIYLRGKSGWKNTAQQQEEKRQAKLEI